LLLLHSPLLGVLFSIVFDSLVTPLAVEISPSDSRWTAATMVAPLEVLQAPLEVIAVLVLVFGRHRLHVACDSPLELAAYPEALYSAGDRLHH
jgi:ABC-type enterochelin transport system permease subunit